MLSNAYFLAKFRFDTAENELSGDVDLIRHVLPPGIPTGKVESVVLLQVIAPQDLRRLLLGWIDSYDSNQILIFSGFSRSTKLSG